MSRRAVALLGLAVVGIGATMSSFSTAVFTSRSTADATVSAAVDWTPPTVSLQNPGSPVKGQVSLTASAADGETGVKNVDIQYLAANSTTWVTICTVAASPYSCAWDTTTVANGSHDLRARATDNAGYSATSQPVAKVLVDNLGPTVTMLDPGSPLSGTRTFEASASDAHSGVARVVIQYAPAGSSAFANLCTITASPYSCQYNTATLADGTYSFRATAVDLAGNTTTSATVNDRVVRNTVSSVAMQDPGPYLGGTVTLPATASSTAGVTSVRIQRAASGTTNWVDVCTDNTSPYSCSWDSKTVADGLYDFRAILVDGTGTSTTSPAVTGRRVDNSPLVGVDVQASNGGSTAGKVEPGDRITFTYSKPVALSTVTQGWTGDAIAVSLRLRDGSLLPVNAGSPTPGDKDDTVDVLRSGASVNLGSVNLKDNYIASGNTAVFNATMTAGTSTVNGVARTTVTVTLGTLASGGNGATLRTVTATPTMVWTPSAIATDIFGTACSTGPVTETGPADQDF